MTLKNDIITSPFADWMLRQVTPFYNDDYYNLSVFNSIGIAVDSLAQYIYSLQGASAPLTADEVSVQLWESVLDITPDSKADLSSRQAAITAALNANQRMNKYRLERLLNMYVPNGSVEIIEHYNDYMIEIVIKMSGEGYDQKSMIEMLEKYKPAHIGYVSDKTHYHNLYLGAVTIGGDVNTLMPAYPKFSDIRTKVTTAAISYGADSFVVMPKKPVYTNIRNKNIIGMAMYQFDALTIKPKGVVTNG